VKEMEFLDDLWPHKKNGDASEPISEKTRNKIIRAIDESRYVYLNPLASSLSGEPRRFDELEQLEYEILKQNGYGGRLPYSTRGLSLESTIEYLITCTTNEFLQTIEIYVSMKIDNIQTRSFPTDLMQKFIINFNKIMSIDSLPYRLEINKVILVDSELHYQELIKPTLKLLGDPKFESANNEFRRALEQQRKGRDTNDDVARNSAIREANNAFESVMKVKVGNDDLTAEQLITECKKKNIIAPQYENFGIETKKLFQTLPKLRHDKSDAHGKGDKKIRSSDRDVSFAINLAATFIIYVAEG